MPLRRFGENLCVVGYSRAHHQVTQSGWSQGMAAEEEKSKEMYDAVRYTHGALRNFRLCVSYALPLHVFINSACGITHLRILS